ncbi:MAG: hypothetical protein ED557_04095 [Balneola sp.]|nr:MAG: hypothetical protein ED557_04095 [Balneola sp.]
MKTKRENKHLKKAYYIIPLAFLAFTSYWFLSSSSFEKLDNDAKDLFIKNQSPIQSFLDQGYELEDLGTEIKYGGISKSFPNRVYIRFVDNDNLGLITGLPQLDSGWKFLVFPTYSKLLVLKKEDLSIVFQKRINEPVRDLIIRDGYIYFEYGTYPDLEYGRFKFE